MNARYTLQANGTVISDHDTAEDAVRTALATWHEESGLQTLTVHKDGGPALAVLTGVGDAVRCDGHAYVTWANGVHDSYLVTYRIGPDGYESTTIRPDGLDRLLRGRDAVIDATAVA